MVRSLDTLERQLLCLKSIGFEIIHCNFNEEQNIFVVHATKDRIF
jgi:hypothetical protein